MAGTLLEDYEELMHELWIDGHVEYKKKPYGKVIIRYSKPTAQEGGVKLDAFSDHLGKMYHHLSTIQQLLKQFETRPKAPFLALRRKSKEEFAHNTLKSILGHLAPRALKNARETLQIFQDVAGGMAPDPVVKSTFRNVPTAKREVNEQATRFAAHVRRLSEFERQK